MARLKDLASSYSLTFDAFGENNTDPNAPSGILTLSDAFHPGLEPAPFTPLNAPPYHLLSGTIKATYNSHRSIRGHDNIYVAPGMMTGNTGVYLLWTIIVIVLDRPYVDTRYYWDLSRHIFRYNHQNAGNASAGLPNNIHALDECRIHPFIEISTC